MSVRQAQAEIDSAEFTEWMAYHALSPIGPWREDVRMGILASTMANVWSGKGAKRLTPDDFIPKFEDAAAPRQQTPEQMLGILAHMTRATGGQVE